MLQQFLYLFLRINFLYSVLQADEISSFQHSQQDENQKGFNKSLVIVSCSGKSGSCTLEASFQAMNLETYRYHVLKPQNISTILSQANDNDILLIDSIRDPIARRIASYFQNLSAHLHLSQEIILRRYKYDRFNFVNILLQEFDRKIIELEQYYGFCSWKDLHYDCLKEDVFDFDKKYQLKQIGNLYFVNLRFDDIQNWETIIRSLPIPFYVNQFNIVPSNRAQDKWYKEIYQDFLKYFTLSQAKFDLILSNNAEELAHFYKEEEIEKLIDRWKPYIRK